jgi:hypothetical protein
VGRTHGGLRRRASPLKPSEQPFDHDDDGSDEEPHHDDEQVVQTSMRIGFESHVRPSTSTAFPGTTSNDVASVALALAILGLTLVGCGAPGGARRVATPADERCELEMVGGRVEPGARDVVALPKKQAWEAAFGGQTAARPHVRARLAGWPARRLAPPPPRDETDRQFMARLAGDTWRGLSAFVDREHRLPVDNVWLSADPRVGDYTNITTVGLRMIAIVAAHELGLVVETEARAELHAVFATLDRLERHAGFFFNYYDTTSLERSSNFVSFVDSAWLTAGLVVVRAAFPELHAAATRLIDAQDYRFFYDRTAQRMSHGYYVHRQSRSLLHYGVFYAESRLGSLLAIGKGDVPEEHWYRMVRTFPPACRWQASRPVGRRPKDVHGHTFFGGWYESGGVRYVPSWGGSMFEALMPTLVLDEPRHAAASLGANGAAHATVQRRYALDTLGYPVWGMSPSATPSGPGYGEYGVRVLGSLGYPPGAVTPHASALALAVTPAEAVANLRRLAERYEIYGDFGFYDAVEPLSGVVTPAYLALDQSMILIAITNHLRHGVVQRHFAADPIVANVLPLLAAEHFFD